MTEERVLQISNDITKDMCKASREELIEVITFWRVQLEKQINKHIKFRDAIMLEICKDTTNQ